jgi:hypothetical protein
LHWLVDARRQVKVIGTGKTAMTEDEVREIYQQTYGED